MSEICIAYSRTRMLTEDIDRILTGQNSLNKHHILQNDKN